MSPQPLVVWMPGGLRTEIHLGAQDTDGALCLLVDHPPPGWALPPHRHLNEAETIHVVAGEFELTVAGQTSRLGPGETARVPRGVVHSGGNVGDHPGHRVVVFSPAGVERFFAQVGAPTPESEFDLGSLLEAAKQNGWEFGEP